MKIDLNENWTMKYKDSVYTCAVPCSLYKVLLDNKEIPDPYYRENEYISTDLCREDVTFRCIFDASPEVLSADMQLIVFHVLHVTNDTPNAEKLTVSCRVRNNKAVILGEFTAEIYSSEMSAAPALAPDLSGYFTDTNDRRTKYIEYTLESSGKVISHGTTLFVRPKEFDFLPAEVNADIEDSGDSFTITLTADCFAKSVCVSFRSLDCVLSDNWFDIHGNEPAAITLPKQDGLTADMLREQLGIRNY